MMKRRFISIKTSKAKIKGFLLFTCILLLLLILYYPRKFHLNNLLHESIQIEAIQKWELVSEASSYYTKIAVDEETKQKIMDLILAPTYYQTKHKGFTSYSGELKTLTISIKCSNPNTLPTYYHYTISNTGEIELMNYTTFKSPHYLITNFHYFSSFYFDPKGIELYESLYHLITKKRNGS